MKFLAFVGVLAILTLALYFVRTSGAPKLFEQNSKTEKTRPPIFMREVELLEYRNDEMKWRFKALEAYIYEDQNLIKMKNPEVKMRLNNSDKDRVIIKADSGEIKGRSQTAVIWGRAIVRFTDKRTLFAKRVFIDQKKRIIYTKSNVRMVYNKGVTRGDSMLYNLKTGLLTIAGPRVEIMLN